MSPSSPPDEAALHEAALAYLARYAATEAALRMVLNRRIDRWAQTIQDPDERRDRVSAARQAAQSVVARLVAAGVVNDSAFAESKGRSLQRAGRSRQAVTAQLAAKGVKPDLAREAVPEDRVAEVAAALVLARRRRIGPFRTSEPAERQREFGIMARAGFSREIAQQALAMDPDEAEAAIRRLRQG